MSGLIDSTTGLEYGTGLNWLNGGLGTPGLTNPVILPNTTMVNESGTTMVTETDVVMVTE